MKRVVLSNSAAKEIVRLRDDIGSYEFAKKQIADAQCVLANMLNHGRDKDSDISNYADSVITIMGVLSDYNSLVDGLSERNDHEWEIYHMDKEDFEEGNMEDYIPDEKELDLIGKVLESENVKLEGRLRLDEMTFFEIADAVGIHEEELRTKVREMKHNNKG